MSNASQINENSLARHARHDWHGHPLERHPCLWNCCLRGRKGRKHHLSGSEEVVLLENENIKNIFRLSGQQKSLRTDRCRQGKWRKTQRENKSASRNPPRCLWTELCKFRRLFLGFSAGEEALKTLAHATNGSSLRASSESQRIIV